MACLHQLRLERQPGLAAIDSRECCAGIESDRQELAGNPDLRSLRLRVRQPARADADLLATGCADQRRQHQVDGYVVDVSWLRACAAAAAGTVMMRRCAALRAAMTRTAARMMLRHFSAGAMMLRV